MKNTDAEPSYETLEIGTPKDYTSDMYKVYFELAEYKDIALNILKDFLGEDRENSIVTLAHGYELELPNQCIPDIVRLLCEQDIAIYQIVRYAKLDKEWS